MPSILALDQGTTSSRAIVFDQDGAIAGVAQKEFAQIFPAPGWVEHDPQELWASQIGVAVEALGRAQVRPKDVAAIGIANQRETTIVWDRETGEPIHNAIVWQDRRTADYCERLKADGVGDTIQAKTGLLIDAYFSASKIRWLLDNVAGARARADAGKLAFGTVDTWLVWKLTNRAVHVTDVTNASRTMLFNIHALKWDPELLALFGIPESMLPTVRSSSEVYGHVSQSLGVDGIAIAGIAGDQQAALFGQMCRRPGMSKNTYGIRTAPEIEALAASVADNGGVYLVPAFAGLGAPHWDPYARGTIVGMTRGTTAAHIARAALESIAYQVSDLLDAMAADAGIGLKELRVDGGAATNNTLMQFQADLLGVPVVRPVVTETTALGAAYLAGLAVGFWPSVDAIGGQWKVDRRFEPSRPQETVAALRGRWSDALARSRGWDKPV